MEFNNQRVGLTGVCVDRTCGSRAIAILDAERPAFRERSRRRTRVVHMLVPAGRARTFVVRNPKVGGARVEIDKEGLSWRAYGNCTGPLAVVVFVGERLCTCPTSDCSGGGEPEW